MADAPAAKPAPAAPAAAPAAVAPAAPAPTPTGDFATVAALVQGCSYAVLDDGAGVLTVPADDFFTAASRVKGLGYRVLSLLSAYDRTDHFGVLYAFLKVTGHPGEFAEFRLRVTMPKKDAAGAVVEPVCASLCDLYPGAEWQEREMFDMYGIKFAGNPDLRRMFLPEDWTGHPMRKDYKEPEQFVGMREGEDVTVRSATEGAW